MSDSGVTLCVFQANMTPTQGVTRQRTLEDEIPIMMEPDSELDIHKLGKIQFCIKYDFQEMTLTLKIMRAIDLPAKDFSGTSDPYVKILLLPDKKHKLQTNIKRKNLNPRWNELFAFEGECELQSFSGCHGDWWLLF